jgi:hypothetical protein
VLLKNKNRARASTTERCQLRVVVPNQFSELRF